MIYLYTGTPGSGKSLHLARELYHYLNAHRDRLVLCNFDIDLSRVKHPERYIYLSNRALRDPSTLIQILHEYYLDYPLKERSVVLVIDECQILFNSRDWRSTNDSGWLPFFTQHRKFGADIYLVAQFDEMVDKQIRSLVEYEVVHRKISNFGIFGGILKLLTFGELFIAIERWYGINQKTGQEFFKARKKYYSLYDTFNTFKQA